MQLRASSSPRSDPTHLPPTQYLALCQLPLTHRMRAESLRGLEPGVVWELLICSVTPSLPPTLAESSSVMQPLCARSLHLAGLCPNLGWGWGGGAASLGQLVTPPRRDIPDWGQKGQPSFDVSRLASQAACHLSRPWRSWQTGQRKPLITQGLGQGQKHEVHSRAVSGSWVWECAELVTHLELGPLEQWELGGSLPRARYQEDDTAGPPPSSWRTSVGPPPLKKMPPASPARGGPADLSHLALTTHHAPITLARL